MRAAYIDQYGPPDNLKIGELDVPNPGVDEVLIKVNYASINPIDYKVRRGDLLRKGARGRQDSCAHRA